MHLYPVLAQMAKEQILEGRVHFCSGKLELNGYCPSSCVYFEVKGGTRLSFETLTKQLDCTSSSRNWIGGLRELTLSPVWPKRMGDICMNTGAFLTKCVANLKAKEVANLKSSGGTNATAQQERVRTKKSNCTQSGRQPWTRQCRE